MFKSAFLSMLLAFAGFAASQDEDFTGAPCHVDSARTYINALYAKTRAAAAAVPLEVNVIRTEGDGATPNIRITTARSAPELRLSIYAGTSVYTPQGAAPEGLEFGTLGPQAAVVTYNASISAFRRPARRYSVVQYVQFNSPEACRIGRIEAVYYSLDG